MNEDLRELLESANEDLEAAKILFDKSLFKLSTFHCQQSVEKYLKAYLLYKTGFYPFIHSISNLLEKCMKVDKDFEYLKNIGIHILEEYYIRTRYPIIKNITEEDAKEAIEIAEKVKEFILNKLNI